MSDRVRILVKENIGTRNALAEIVDNDDARVLTDLVAIGRVKVVTINDDPGGPCISRQTCGFAGIGCGCSTGLKWYDVESFRPKSLAEQIRAGGHYEHRHATNVGPRLGQRETSHHVSGSDGDVSVRT